MEGSKLSSGRGAGIVLHGSFFCFKSQPQNKISTNRVCWGRGPREAGKGRAAGYHLSTSETKRSQWAVKL